MMGPSQRNPASDGRVAAVRRLDWRDWEDEGTETADTTWERRIEAAAASPGELLHLGCGPGHVGESQSGAAQLVIGAALVYGEHHAAPLAATICRLLQRCDAILGGDGGPAERKMET